MKRSITFITVLLFLLAVVGCASFREAAKRDWKEGTTGAVAGAIVGVAVTADNAASNIAGASIGAAGGFLLGVGAKEGYNYLFKRNEEDQSGYLYPPYPVDSTRTAFREEQETYPRK